MFFIQLNPEVRTYKTGDENKTLEMARADQSLIFNPEEHTSDTLKSFDDFKMNFEFRYAAEFPDPPKVYGFSFRKMEVC